MAKVTYNGQNVLCRVTMNIYIIYCVLRTYVTYMNMGFININQIFNQNTGF